MPWDYISDVDAFTIYHRIREEEEQEASSSALSPFSSPSSFSSAIGHALAGSCGTAVSNTLLYPLDLVITRLQVQRKNKNKRIGSRKGKEKATTASPPPTEEEQEDDEETYDGILDAFRKIYAHGGISAFYAGVTQDTAKSMLDSFLFFLAYNVLWQVNRRYFSSRTSSSSALTPSSKSSSSAAPSSTARRVLAEITMGVLAGAATKGLTSPIQQIVTRKQTLSTTTSPSTSSTSATAIAHHIYSTKGLAGFWAGYRFSLLLTLNPSLTFLVDSALRRAISARRPSDLSTRPLEPSATFLVAAMGKAVASSVTYPLSVGKTRAQADVAASRGGGAGGRSGGGGVLLALKGLVEREGVAGLYSGLGAEVMKGFFSHGLTMLVKERVVWVLLGMWQLLRRWVVRLRGN